MDSIVFKSSLAAFFIYVTQFLFYKMANRHDDDTDAIVKKVSHELSTHYKDQLQLENIDQDQLHADLYELLVVMSNKEQQTQSDNKGYWLMVFFALVVVLLGRRASELDSSTLVTVFFVTLFSSIFQYNFYTHFVKGYRTDYSYETIVHLLRHKLDTYGVKGLRCDN